MRFNIKALAFTTAICWGGSILITGLANLIWTTYGVTMSKRIGRALVGVLTVATIGVAGSGCRQDSQSEPEPSKIGIQEQHEQRKADLVVQFSDDFSQDYGPPDYFDMTRWTRLYEAQARTEGGYWLMDVLHPPPPGPGLASLDVVFGGFATTERTFNPGLAGTNGVEITLVDFSHEKDYSEEMEAPEEIVNWTQNLDHCWSLTVASWQGWVGDQDDDQRGVQLHFDLLRDDGLFVYLVRGLLPEDYEKYPRDGFGRDHSRPNQNLSPRELRDLHEKEIAHGGVFISEPAISLAARVYRTEQEIQDILGRSRRWGLYLTDDASTVYWTLDDQVMDTIDISGYFTSSPESVQGGSFLTVMGLGTYQQNTWRMDDLEVHVSP